ncbi:Uma2 family endonuclease [Cytophagaceae bacterium SJW1-29]|uniref:Uma2 family endonuclease n=1 Tax=Salmonirosea aquatica TaxID=2654236 RepID=A0A7C9FDH9_9BACT|nr:Uma2 family endonuclease [Cytophagaceae bacterium SJW1-29]
MPTALVKETIDGRPFYYPNFKKVLAGEQTLDDVMGSSTLQSFIVSFLFRFVYRNLDEKQYYFLGSEIGLHIDKRNNLAGDLALFERSTLTIKKINVHYADVPPKAVVEVDTNIDYSEEGAFDYVHLKTQKLLDFGVQRVIWIFTISRKVIVAEPGKDWLTKDWNQDIELLDAKFFNIGKYLAEEGIELE